MNNLEDSLLAMQTKNCQTAKEYIFSKKEKIKRVLVAQGFIGVTMGQVNSHHNFDPR